MPVRFRLGLLVLVAVLVGCSGARSVDTSTTSTVPSSTAPASTAPSTTVTTAPACDPLVAEETFNTATAAARLVTTGDPWVTDTSGSAYVDAVVEPGDFADSLGLRCSSRMVQGVGTDHERLGLAAWTGERMGYVVLALDHPTQAYDETVRFDLLFEQPWGEWVADDVWAVTISSGDTVIVGVNDYFIGAVAKSFLVAFPEPPGAEPEIPAEEYAIAALEDAGMVNVGIAEPSDTEAASIAFTTPLGNVMIATVGPTASFDPFVGYLAGESTITVVGGIEIQTTLAAPDQSGIADVAFVCSEYGWRIESSLGSSHEPLNVAIELIGTLDCGA